MNQFDQNEAISLLFEGFYQQRFQNENHDGLNKEKLKEIYLKSIDKIKKNKNFFSEKERTEEYISEFATILDFSFGEYRFAKDLTVEEIADRVCFRYNMLNDVDIYNEIFTDNTNYFDPVISTIRSMEIFLYKINKPLTKKKPNLTLIMDICDTIFKKIAGFCKMMNFGLYTDAFVSWRTLHESECILALLVNGGENIRQAYVEHIAYNNQLRNQENYTKEELDMRFEKMKEVMKSHGLKSKDMKKFIEYGWIYNHPDFDENDKSFKLNFRDGVERLAKLRRYSSIYEASSEITHSSSTFFYADDNECKQLALGLTYESFKRIVLVYHQFLLTYFLIHKNDEIIFKKLFDDLETMQKRLTKECQMQIINYPSDEEPTILSDTEGE